MRLRACMGIWRKFEAEIRYKLFSVQKNPSISLYVRDVIYDVEDDV